MKLSSSKVMKGCVGAVDGWLRSIRVPRKKEVTRVRSFFSSYYQIYGVNSQVYCDHYSRFTAVTCSSPGGTGDAAAYLKWKLSSVVDARQRVQQHEHVFDSVPKTRIATAYHDSFNFYLSQLCIRLEMAFGLLVFKWRVFNAPLEILFNRVPRTILAAFILHNWYINRRLHENTNYRVEEDEVLADGSAALKGVQTPDASVAPQDPSRYIAKRTVNAHDSTPNRWVHRKNHVQVNLEMFHCHTAKPQLTVCPLKRHAPAGR
ncbi:hypothetical protein JG688_00012263 [Phytophthora aleatoria]|uniref:DDE Tnp4 domain-containing protein n=1 Tax=Phytophthora aleatoria TaxID=2496075 RepID=A0A8J5IFJ4_9STRA|nr:hypothetical protein JG688_00012263 [Phytophthora aleatoria]